MRFFRKASFLSFICIIFIVFFGFFSSGVNAQIATPTPITTTTTQPPTSAQSPCGTGAEPDPRDPVLSQVAQSSGDFVTTPALLSIDETLPCVDVTFNGLTKNTKYYLCTGDSECLGTGKISDDNVLTDNSSTSDEQGNNVHFRVCGDGDNRLKIEGCSPDSTDNWFTGGNAYYFGVVAKTNKNDKYQPVKTGAFFVQKYFPKFEISPKDNLTVDTKSVTVSIFGKGFPIVGGENRNDYQITMKGGDNGYDSEDCVSVGDHTTFNNISSQGKYIISINDQINEPETAVGAAKSVVNGGGGGGGGLFGFVPNPVSAVKNLYQGVKDLTNLGADILSPKDIPKDAFKTGVHFASPIVTAPLNLIKSGLGVYNAFDNTVQNRCQGGLVYWQITCTFTNAAPGGKCEDPVKDPTGEEYRTFLAELAQLNSAGAAYNFQCGDGKQHKNSLECHTINTAIGPIDTTPAGFVTSIFKIVLMLATFGGIIILIYSGYLLMISRGDKEKIQAARETITAAIVGMLFIVLSIVILEIIGVDILKIPGFSK